MKKLFLIIILSACAGLSGYAQDKNAEIKKLLNLMNSEKMMKETMRNMMNVMKQQVSSKIQGENAEQKKEKVSALLVEESTQIVNKMINEDMVSIYDKHFNEAEINDLITFYQSPSGKKFLEKTPAITGELMGIAMQKHLPVLQQRIKAKMEEIK